MCCCRFTSAFTFSDAFYTGLFNYVFLLFALIKVNFEYRSVLEQVAFAPTLADQLEVYQEHFATEGLSWTITWLVSLLVSQAWQSIYWSKIRPNFKKKIR